MAPEKVPVSFKVDKNDKEEASEIYNELGMNLTTAFNMFLKKNHRRRWPTFRTPRSILQ